MSKKMPHAELWLVPVTSITTAQARSVTTDADKARAGAYRTIKDQERALNGRALLRMATAHYLHCDPHRLDISNVANHRPELTNITSPPILSLSHSGDYILVGVGSAQIGVDIEKISDGIDYGALKESVLSPYEQRIFATLDPTMQRDAFFNFWTQKEAYLKALGIGLAQEPNSFSVALDGGTVRDETQIPHATKPLAAPLGYRAAVCVEGADFSYHTNLSID